MINAKLIVVTNDAYLTDVKKVGQAPLPKAPADVPAPSASSGFELLKPGEAVPDTAFVDQDGRKRTFQAFKGTPRAGDLHLHELPDADVLPADGPALSRPSRRN